MKRLVFLVGADANKRDHGDKEDGERLVKMGSSITCCIGETLGLGIFNPASCDALEREASNKLPTNGIG